MIDYIGFIPQFDMNTQANVNTALSRERRSVFAFLNVCSYIEKSI